MGADGIIRPQKRTIRARSLLITALRTNWETRFEDHIIFPDKGLSVQAGIHEELPAQPGIYRGLWELQRLLPRPDQAAQVFPPVS